MYKYNLPRLLKGCICTLQPIWTFQGPQAPGRPGVGGELVCCAAWALGCVAVWPMS